MERLYRALLRLYPADFRERFAEEQVQLFHDKLRDARAAHGRWGTMNSWLTMLADVVATATSERLRRYRQVAHSTSAAPSVEARVLGLAGIVGGVALLTAFVVNVPSGLNALRIALFLAGAIAVAIATLRVGPRPGPLSLLAGAALIAVSAWYAVLVMTNIHGDVLFATGVALWPAFSLYGLTLVRQGGLIRWGALALVIGSVLAVTGIDRLGLVSEAAPTIFNTLSTVGIVMVGIGWIVMGIEVATRRSLRAPAIEG